MDMTIIRLAFALFVLALAAALFVIAGSPRRRNRDPALALLRIPLTAEIAMVAAEAGFLASRLAGVAPPLYLSILSEAAQIGLGFAYVLFTYKSWQANGLSLAGYPRLAWFAAVSALNLAVVAARYAWPGLEPLARPLGAVLLGAILLYAGFCAVTGRGKKPDFYPSTKGGFWMAFFCLAYFPFVGIFSLAAMPAGGFDPARTIALQLFPLREMVVLGIYALHLEPLYSRLWGSPETKDAPLSQREGEIAALVRQGLTNPEISARLNLSLATVKTHVRNILRKSGAAKRSELPRRAAEAKQ